MAGSVHIGCSRYAVIEFQLVLLCHLAKKSLVARICNSMLHIGQRQTNRMAIDFLMPMVEAPQIERTGCARTS